MPVRVASTWTDFSRTAPRANATGSILSFLSGSGRTHRLHLPEHRSDFEKHLLTKKRVRMSCRMRPNCSRKSLSEHRLEPPRVDRQSGRFLSEYSCAQVVCRRRKPNGVELQSENAAGWRLALFVRFSFAILLDRLRIVKDRYKGRYKDR